MMKRPWFTAIAACGVVWAVPAMPDTSASGAASSTASGAASGDPASLELQNEFDPIGAEVRSLSRDGRLSYYIDEGGSDEGGAQDRAVVFIGGQGTSLEAFQLTEFARTMRRELGLRVISVERNGFGELEFDPDLGYRDYANEVLAVLDELGIGDFVIMAISGGGAYAAHLAAAAPERVISIHAGAAVSRTLPGADYECSGTAEERREALRAYTEAPKEWWGVPGSPMLVIPGWQTRAYADATRTFYLGGQMGDPAALTHEYMLPCGDNAVADVSKVQAPVYLYYGAEDEAVTVEEMRDWEEAFPNIAKATVYPGEGHTPQYRHWDQILADMAGYGDHTVVCREGATRLVPNGEVRADDPLGLCAWQGE